MMREVALLPRISVLVLLAGVLLGLGSIAMLPFISASVDVVSNGDQWYVCNANAAPTLPVQATEVTKYGILPPSAKLTPFPSGYPCLISCAAPAYTLYPGPQYCDADGDHYSDWTEAQTTTSPNTNCLYNGQVGDPATPLPQTFYYVTDSAKCSICNPNAHPSSGPDCNPSTGICDPTQNPNNQNTNPTNPTKTSCTNKNSYGCLNDVALAETPDSCAKNIDNDQDGKAGCADPDCVALCKGDATTTPQGTCPIPGGGYLNCQAKSSTGVNCDALYTQDPALACKNPACINYWKDSNKCTGLLGTANQQIIVAASNSFMCYAADGSDYFAECCAGGVC